MDFKDVHWFITNTNSPIIVDHRDISVAAWIKPFEQRR